jgi:hypothetical protein
MYCSSNSNKSKKIYFKINQVTRKKDCFSIPTHHTRHVGKSIILLEHKIIQLLEIVKYNMLPTGDAYVTVDVQITKKETKKDLLVKYRVYFWPTRL